jgi:hypothetical protein
MTKEINTIKANTMVLDKNLFFNGFHSLENIFLLISLQWSKCFGYRGQQIILKLTIIDSRCWQSGTTMTWILISGLSCKKANTMVLDKKLFFSGFHSLENIFLLRNNLNVLKFKRQPLAMNFNIWIILNTNGSTYYRINQK